MRFIWMIAIYALFGYLPICSFASKNYVKQNSVLETLKNLVYVDMYAPNYTTQHPLVCGTSRDFPRGRELIFKNINLKKSIHAVFPEKNISPKKLDGIFILHGHFQNIQNKKNYKFKKPSNNYRYFVVSSWERIDKK